jgi:hypothetical protein
MKLFDSIAMGGSLFILLFLKGNLSRNTGSKGII